MRHTKLYGLLGPRAVCCRALEGTRNKFFNFILIVMFLFFSFFRSTSMEWRARRLLAELGNERIFIGMCEHRAVRKNAWSRYGCVGTRRFLGHCATIYWWYSLGTFGDFTKRFVQHSFIHIKVSIDWLIWRGDEWAAATVIMRIIA